MPTASRDSPSMNSFRLRSVQVTECLVKLHDFRRCLDRMRQIGFVNQITNATANRAARRHHFSCRLAAPGTPARDGAVLVITDLQEAVQGRWQLRQILQAVTVRAE